jgi:hypothetical protein
MAITSLLLVEDDEQKLDQIRLFLGESFPEYELSVQRSFQSGLKAISENPPTLLLLDMTLTTFDIGQDEEGGRPRPYGGREILEHMEEGGIAVQCIVVTQYSAFGTTSNKMTLADLDHELSTLFPGIYRGTVYYHAATESWKGTLRDMILRVVSGESKC